MPKGPRVFLSYCRADKERAVNLERASIQRGLHVWRDELSELIIIIIPIGHGKRIIIIIYPKK